MAQTPLSDELMEFSVVFTDRSLNHMSQTFQQVMRDIYETMTGVYSAEACVLVPGGGTYAMESVARQFAGGQDVLIVRNGWFSFRWTQIFEASGIAKSETVCKARPQSEDPQAAWSPAPIEEVVASILETKPGVVFAPHVETSAGLILPDDYIAKLAEAVHSVGGLMVLDCIASGAMWVDMKAVGVDVLISAPQKGWSASPSAGIVMLNQAALDRMAETKTSSFALDLGKWHSIMQAYVSGGHAYHATMPTDALRGFRDAMLESKAYGFDVLRQRQAELGQGVRQLLAQRGIASVAAPGFEAPGVVVSYTQDDGVHKGAKFAALGMQIAAGVPLACDEPATFKTFRLGLFGLDKLYDPQAAIGKISAALDDIGL
jgi:aspartate aminotransferase-like enzyme